MPLTRCDLYYHIIQNPTYRCGDRRATLAETQRENLRSIWKCQEQINKHQIWSLRVSPHSALESNTKRALVDEKHGTSTNTSRMSSGSVVLNLVDQGSLYGHNRTHHGNPKEEL
jgi:hypothetical protein